MVSGLGGLGFQGSGFRVPCLGFISQVVPASHLAQGACNRK